jgi:hypothetical protein
VRAGKHEKSLPPGLIGYSATSTLIGMDSSRERLCSHYSLHALDFKPLQKQEKAPPSTGPSTLGSGGDGNRTHLTSLTGQHLHQKHPQRLSMIVRHDFAVGNMAEAILQHDGPEKFKELVKEAQERMKEG